MIRRVIYIPDGRHGRAGEEHRPGITFFMGDDGSAEDVLTKHLKLEKANGQDNDQE